MADLTGSITESTWTAADDHRLTGNVTLTLGDDLTYTGTLTDDGNGPYTITLASDTSGTLRTLNVVGATMSAANVSTWTFNTDSRFTFDTDNKFGVVPENADADHITLNGGTLHALATADISLVANRGVTVSAASTIANNVNDQAQGGDLYIRGIVAGAGNITVTGGDNSTYLPSTIFTGVNTGTGTIVCMEGNNLEFQAAMTTDIKWAGNVDLGTSGNNNGGDLKGTGTISGNVNSYGGRVSPGTTVGSTLAITGNLVLDANTEMYFGIEGTSTALHDALTVGGNMTLNGGITVAPYTATIAQGNYTLVDVAGTTTPAASYTIADEFEHFGGWAGDTDGDRMPEGSFTGTAPTIAVTSNDIVITYPA